MALHRTCIDCGKLTKQGRCAQCRKQRYGPAHQAEREQWRGTVNTGQVRCWSCHELIVPTAEPGNGWDMGHAPGQPTRPQHAACNRSDAARGVG